MRMMPSGPAEHEQLRGTAEQLIVGTMNYIVDPDTDPHGILLPWRPGLPPGDTDYDDYWTGIGVFMRYMLYAYQNNADLKDRLQQQDAQDFVRANAEYVAKHPDRPQSGDTVVNLTNNLATLVAAVGILTP